MDFSVYEKRQLAVLERQLTDDRRLVAMLAAFGSDQSALRKRVRCQVARLRHHRPGPGSRPARIAVVAALCLTLAGPLVLIASLVFGIQVLSLVAVGMLPVAPLLLVLAQHWVRRSSRRQATANGPGGPGDDYRSPRRTASG